MKLTREEFDRFIETCRNPPEPSEELKAIVKEFGRFALSEEDSNSAIYQKNNFGQLD